MTSATLPSPAASSAAPSSRPAVLAGSVGIVAFVAGQALFPVLGPDVESAFAAMLALREQLLLSRLLTAAGAFLLVASVPPLLALAPVRGRRLLLVGLALLATGTFFNAVSHTVQGYAAWATTAPGVDAAAAMPALLHLDAGLAGLPVSYWSVPVFGLGVVLTGVALLVARTVPLWMPVLLLLGAVLAFATAGLGPVVALTQAPLAVALVALLLTSGRRSGRSGLVVAPSSVHAQG
ncbi:hypothetical protein DT076_01900 [Desertihabitans brevis]|uniref:DUF4386 family protein n=1 Tax=Desertihabitans brevis TaxID=2268447 RepID=A0A367YZA5_9ACTN|nr:hypothetical protein [Desertihabitans brevis]RCK71226.1 hypothetical protein DT076_01900 [Desertihabitans brevis]